MIEFLLSLRTNHEHTDKDILLTSFIIKVKGTILILNSVGNILFNKRNTLERI